MFCNNGFPPAPFPPIGPVVPPMYPYMGQNYYACDCCSHMHQPTLASEYPTNGPLKETTFMLVNTTPYLVDYTNIAYGTKICVADQIYTRISSRRDVSCVNLTGTIDMTEGIVTQSTLESFLIQTIANQYETLEDVLSIQKSAVQFKLYFHVEDELGGTVYQSTTTTVVPKFLMHYTDILNYRVTSFKSIFDCNIPSLDYSGVYTLILDKIEAYANVIVTKDHLVNETLNPFYEFKNSNTKIHVEHDTIEKQTPDGSTMIASLNLNWGTAFQANLTTRLKLSFVAYMSNMFATTNTFNFYNALFEPTPEIVNHLEEQVKMLTEIVQVLQNAVVKEYAKGISLKRGELVWLVPGTLYQSNLDFITDSDPDRTVEQSFNYDIGEGNLVPVGGA